MKKLMLFVGVAMVSAAANAYEVGGFEIGKSIDDVQTDLSKKESSMRTTFKNFEGGAPEYRKDSVEIKIKHSKFGHVADSISFKQIIHNLECGELRDKLESKYGASFTSDATNALFYKNLNSLEDSQKFGSGEIWESIEITCQDAPHAATLSIKTSSVAQAKENRKADIAAMNAGQPKGSASQAAF